MNLDTIGPRIEQKLYAYASLLHRRPEAPISHVYEGLIEFGILGVVSRSQGQSASPQERWVLANERWLREAAAIERAMQQMGFREKRVIQCRYFMDWEWRRVAAAVQTTERHAFNLRDRAFEVLAVELGLWGRKEEDVAPAGVAAAT